MSRPVVKSQILALSLSKPEIEQADVEQQCADLVDHCGQLVAWIRDQEGTVTTWFVEAFAAES